MSEKRFKHLSLILFFIYVIVLYYLLLFYAECRTGILPDEFVRVNLRPFIEIRRIFEGMEKLGFMYFFRNFIGNIVIFVPFGMLMPCAFDRCAKLWKTALCGFATSFLIESFQLITKIGIFDVDDIIMNTAGVFVGYLIYRLILLKIKKSLCSK